MASKKTGPEAERQRLWQDLPQVPRDTPDKRMLRYGVGGALLAEDDCDGLAERLDVDSARSYGAPYILAESMSRRTAEIFARAFGRALVVEL
jgi:hypothetical protein